METAMLVNLSIKKHDGRKLDREVTEYVNSAKKADKAAGRFHKQIIPKAALEPIVKVTNAARNYHYFATLPWYDNGFRILPSKMFLEYTTKMREFKAEYGVQVGRFLANYPSYIKQAEILLGDMYKESDYPSVDEISRRFEFDTHFTQLPNGEDFRVDISESELDKIRQDIQSRTSSAIKKASDDVWGRINNYCERIYDALTRPKGMLRESLINNLDELSTILPLLNINDDPELSAVNMELRLSICKYDIDQIRNNETVKEEVTNATKEIIQRIKARNK